MCVHYVFLQAQDAENIILVDYRTVPVPVESLDPTKIYYYTRYFFINLYCTSKYIENILNTFLIVTMMALVSLLLPLLVEEMVLT